MKLSVVIPAYNERTSIEEIVRRVQAQPLDIPREIVVVDDCSTDGTRDILKSWAELAAAGQRHAPSSDGATPVPLIGVRVLFQENNLGKGAALRRGFAEATGDILLVQDADLEYDPRDYPRLLEPILSGRGDVVFGTRFYGGTQRVHYFWHYVGNSFLTLLSDSLTNLKLTDMECGYKVFRREVLANLRIRSDRFGFEPEITAKVAKGKWRVFEVPISYFGRTYQEGKKITWRDGVKALFTILRFRIMD